MKRQYPEKPAVKIKVSKPSNEKFFVFLQEAMKSSAKDTKLVTLLARALHTDMFLSTGVQRLTKDDDVSFYTVVRANFVGEDGEVISIQYYKSIIKHLFSELKIKATFQVVQPKHDKKQVKEEKRATTGGD